MRKFTILPIFAVLLACGPSRVEKLSERLELYNKSIRWQSLQAAGALIDEGMRRSIIQKLSETLNKNRVIDFSILDVAVNPKKSESTVIVQYSFVRTMDESLQLRQEIQSWRYDTKVGDWMLTSVREFRPQQP